MNEAKAVRLIKKFHPETLEDFRNIGLPLHCIGSGVFREVCRIDGSELVVKFPLSEDSAEPDYRAGKLHSTVEVRKIKALSKFPEIRPHLPIIHYHNKKTGVLVMKYYPRYDDREKQIEHLGHMIRKLVKRLTGVNCSDIHINNVHLNKDRGVMIDLGY